MDRRVDKRQNGAGVAPAGRPAARLTDADVEAGRQIYADARNEAELSWDSAMRPDASGASVQAACRALGTALSARMRTLGCRAGFQRVLNAVRFDGCLPIEGLPFGTVLSLLGTAGLTLVPAVEADAVNGFLDD